jgi:hypothetical protein
VTKRRVNEFEADKRERLREINRRKAAKSAELKEKAQLDELYRAQKSRENYKETYEHKLKTRIKTVLKRHEKTKKLANAKVRKEVASAHQIEK